MKTKKGMEPKLEPNQVQKLAIKIIRTHFEILLPCTVNESILEIAFPKI
jgi:hypothetical protein